MARSGFRRWLLWGAGAMLVVAAAWAVYEWLTWPDVARLATANPETSAFIQRYVRRNPDAKVEWRWVPYSRISPNLKRAVLVAEDINFFSHEGFDTGEMKKAWREAMDDGKPLRGASTISQQTVKNLWLSGSRNPLRKLKEALLTMQLERALPKRRILELYLNLVELGPGVYGAEAGARHYFGKPAASLSEQDAAELAASLTRPSDWHPGVGTKGYRRRVEAILRRMEKAAWLRNEI